MRTGLLFVIAVLLVGLVSAAVTPEEFRSSHGHKKHQKETLKEEAASEDLGPSKEPVKVQAPKPRPTPFSLKPLIHPIPSHPPAHAESVPNHHHRAQISGPKPLIHPIPSHPPPVEAKEAAAERPKKHEKKDRKREE